ncbi:hypothetical protein GOBAR_AA14443 [Gossypium barbadense]|uniref:Endonuclease/exonuclease/phosphatase domain-containing protein n=1 Tax=Gossypium barbadense TaxID=3634 RepID=A0A2P5XS84_GOSBA|nr:hypothetical protein GOBAR_AA14443 [Gossypium barbadense]
MEELRKRDSWNLLRFLGHDCAVPWLAFGDFNEITSSFEKKGGRLRPEGQMAEFRSALEDCSLHDIGFNGRWFTWEKGRFSFTNIRERLDRGVTSLQWIDLFPWFSLEHLNHSFSDHCPILVDTFGKLRLDNSRKQSSFRFEAKCCLDNSFEEIVRKIWAVQNDYLPAKLTTDPTDEILAEILEVQLGLNLEADKEEFYWSPRAHINWLKNGDRNTSFFHKVAVAHHTCNRILGLEDESGQWVSVPEELLKDFR